jgi:hypothetical protein
VHVGQKSYFRAGGRGSLMIMPHTLSGCQIKGVLGLSSDISFV